MSQLHSQYSMMKYLSIKLNFYLIAGIFIFPYTVMVVLNLTQFQMKSVPLARVGNLTSNFIKLPSQKYRLVGDLSPNGGVFTHLFGQIPTHRPRVG